MADRPIIFSTPMVRALLDGRKTQTRRVLKPQPEPGSYRLAVYDPQGFAAFGHDAFATKQRVRLPYAPGDRLWVRETWNQSGLGWGKPRAGLGRLHYRADPDHGWQDYWGRWRSSIHMPRWASRITLTVTEVRVQRLQEISEADAMAEGADYAANNLGFSPISGQPHGVRTFKAGFAHLWNSLHGPDAWDAKPWVCAITFTVRRGNIDHG